MYERTARRDQHRRGDLDDLGGDLLNMNPLHTDRKAHRLHKRFDRRKQLDHHATRSSYHQKQREPAARRPQAAPLAQEV